MSPPSLPKTPFAVCVVDSSLALVSDWAHIFHSYLPHLLPGLAEGNLLCPQLRLGFVTYGPPDCGGSPVLFQRFFAKGALDELKDNPAIIFMGRTCPGSSLGMAALEGYAAAIEMFDILQSDLNQEHSGEFSFHLWHIAAGQPDGAKQPRWCFSSTLRSLTWENLPTELRKRDINCSMILVRPSPKFEELFSEISDTPITQWFPICKDHPILLSGFSPPLQLGAAAPSTVPAKRPAETSVEHCSRGPKSAKFQLRTTAALKQRALEPSPPIPPTSVPPLQELSSTSLAVSPTKAFVSSPPPPAHAPQDSSIIDLTQLTADLDPVAIQEKYPHTFEHSALQQAPPTLLNPAPSFQPQPPLFNWDATRLSRADVAGIRPKRREIAAAQAGRAEEVNDPLRCGRQVVEYETDVPMANGTVSTAQTQHLSHLVPKTNSHSAARLPRRHIDANGMDTGPGSVAYAGPTHWQILNPATTQIPPPDNLCDMPALDALGQGLGSLGMMPQPILRENMQVPCPVGNGAGTCPDACVDATTAGELCHKSDDRWSGTFMCRRSDMPLWVSMIEPLGNALASRWSSVLSLDITPYTLSMLELQDWMKTNGAVMMRFRPASEPDVHKFARLVKCLRERKCYAVASGETRDGGRPMPHLLLVPFGKDLLGAAFPTSVMPQLPREDPTVIPIPLQQQPPKKALITANPTFNVIPQQQPQQRTQQQTDYFPGVNMPTAMSGNMADMQRAPDLSGFGDYVNATTDGLVIQPTWPQQFQEPRQQQGYIYEQHQRLQEQPDRPRALLEMQPVLVGGYDASVDEDLGRGLVNAGALDCLTTSPTFSTRMAVGENTPWDLARWWWGSG